MAEAPPPSDASGPTVSVIVPCFNARPWLAQCLRSVLDQDYEPIEVLVVDDASEDGSAELAASFGERVAVVRHSERRGGAAARNEGFRRSTGEFVQWLDADDLLCPGKLRSQAQVLRDDAGIDVVYGDWRYLFTRPDGATRPGPVIRGTTLLDPLLAHVQGWWATPHAFLQRRASVVEWDESLRAAQDHDYWLGVAMRTSAFCYRPGLVAEYRRHEGPSVSKDRRNWVEGYSRSLEKVERWLLDRAALSISYRRALAKELVQCAFVAQRGAPERVADLLRRALELDPRAGATRRFPFGLVSRLHSIELALELEHAADAARDRVHRLLRG